jgi:GTPase SAR1 family protein
MVGQEGAGKSTLARRLGSARFTKENFLGDLPLDFIDRESFTGKCHVPSTFQIDVSTRKALLEKNKVHDVLEFEHSIKINVHDFVGNDVYHSMSEMFFSEFALHSIVFDISKITSGHECDVLVQYWIDLIQARAPGSTIMLIATHTDLLSYETVEERLTMLKSQLVVNESIRVADLEVEISRIRNVSMREKLRRLQQSRPVLVSDIIHFSENDNSHIGLKALVERIALLTSPTRINPHPFGVINIEIPIHYNSVKMAFNDLRSRGYYYYSILELDNQVRTARELFEGRTLDGETLEQTMNAVAYWSRVGQVKINFKKKR